LTDDVQVAESQLSELRNMGVLLEKARVLARNLAHRRRATLETFLGQMLDEIDRQIKDLRSNRS
jgi:ribosomal protein L13E